MRKKIIAGNWKMNYTLTEADNFVNEIKDRINTDEVDVVICPNNVSLERVSDLLDGTNIKLGAQNVHYEDKGAFTGETSANMLLAVDAKYCIIGHSERRQYFGETDEMVNKKAIKLLEKDITPIICVGETLEQREKGELYDFISSQVKNALKDISEDNVKNNIVIAYEPIWAIGTGVTATSEQAQEMCKYIRDEIRKLYNDKVAESIRIQYGGSVKPSNANEILNMNDIDGALVGGASLTNDFVAIVNY